MIDSSDGIATVLSTLDEETLFALEKTITQGFKRSSTTEEAIYNIIKYSKDILSILRRKAVTREILFNYLDAINVKIQLPVTKNELIDKITEIWNIPQINTFNSESNALASVDAQQNYLTDSVVEMAQQFSTWFYTMLNSGECGSEHFFPDAKLTVNMYTNENCETRSVEGNPEEISQYLTDLHNQNNFYFNLNETEQGIQGKIDPHGLVIIMACGTIHTETVCCGVFEQMFALARDPLNDNNWKVKRTEINLQSQNQVLGTPEICYGESSSSVILAFPPE